MKESGDTGPFVLTIHLQSTVNSIIKCECCLQGLGSLESSQKCKASFWSPHRGWKAAGPSPPSRSPRLSTQSTPWRARLDEVVHCKTVDCNKWQSPWEGDKWPTLKYSGSWIAFDWFHWLGMFSSLCFAGKQYHCLVFPWWFLSEQYSSLKVTF